MAITTLTFGLPLLGLGIRHTAPRTSEIVTCSSQALTLVPWAFRIAALIDLVPHLLPLGARGLGHTDLIPKRRRCALQENRTRSLSLRVNAQNHQESAGRGRQSPSFVVEGQEAILVRKVHALAAFLRDGRVVAQADHEPSRCTHRRDSVSLGSLIEASGSPFRQAHTHQFRQLGRQHSMRLRGAPAPLRQRAVLARCSPIQRKNGEKREVPAVRPTIRVACEDRREDRWLDRQAALPPPPRWLRRRLDGFADPATMSESGAVRQQPPWAHPRLRARPLARPLARTPVRSLRQPSRC